DQAGAHRRFGEGLGHRARPAALVRTVGSGPGTAHPVSDAKPAKWYSDVTRYQWIVLAVASAGWIFDVFEGQLFNVNRNQMLMDILGVASDDPAVRYWGDVLLGLFLAGGTLGGVLFDWLG